MIQRRKVYGKSAPSKDSHKIYIICEGTGTEPDYIEFFTNLSSNLQLITIKPDNFGTDPLKLIDRAKEVLLEDNRKYTLDYMQGDSIWFVIDTDSWEKEGKIQPLRAFCESQNGSITEIFNEVKPYQAWKVAQSNPCFEIWLYYHIYQERPSAEDVEKNTSFKEFVNHCISGGFNNQTHPRFLADAIANAKRNFSKTPDYKIELYTTEMYLLGEEIISFVKRDLDRLKNRLG